MNVQNPVLKGFHPDPSIVKAGNKYYIATSTFEWFPGVSLHESSDLVNWKLIGYALTRRSQLDMKGIPASGGVWAPCLSFDKGTFYLCYTVVQNHDGDVWNMKNYMVTTSDIYGEWSDPNPLIHDGFDPSLYHHHDGKKYIVYRSLHHLQFDGGIALVEFDDEKKCIIGKPKIIFNGTGRGDAEGPHLYYKDNYFYLMVAEGGTGYNHCVTLARSRTIDGPYEEAPNNPILTSKNNSELYLQKAGHGDLVKDEKGNWYMVHLCSRPLSERGKCILGRETAIQEVEWSQEGWLQLKHNSNEPKEDYYIHSSTEIDNNQNVYEGFDQPELNLEFQTQRIPLTEKEMKLDYENSMLHLYGKDFLNSNFIQSLLAIRQRSFVYTAVTAINFNPEFYKQSAGLICYYSSHAYHYLYISKDDEKRKILGIMTCDQDKIIKNKEWRVYITENKQLYLKASVAYDKLLFTYSYDEKEWQTIGELLDASILSDDHVLEQHWAFTGAFVGICCQDISGQNAVASFDYFQYKN